MKNYRYQMLDCCHHCQHKVEYEIPELLEFVSVSKCCHGVAEGEEAKGEQVSKLGICDLFEMRTLNSRQKIYEDRIDNEWIGENNE